MNSEECAICFYDINKNNYVFFSCGHKVCSVCYPKMNKICPLCRHIELETEIIPITESPELNSSISNSHTITLSRNNSNYNICNSICYKISYTILTLIVIYVIVICIVEELSNVLIE